LHEVDALSPQAIFGDPQAAQRLAFIGKKVAGRPYLVAMKSWSLMPSEVA